MPAPSVQMSQGVPINIITPVSQGAGAFLSSAIDLIDYEGVMEFQQNLGAITGSISLNKLTHCDTSGGTYTDVDQGSQAFGTTASALSSVKVNVSEMKRFLKYAANVTTGPVLISVTATGFKKYR
jgi:hypothetical protein